MSDPDAIEGALLPEHAVPLGHDHAIAALDRQMRAGRLPTAVLLHGPQGIGKATLAFEMARQILTFTGDEDANRVNEQIAAGAHPNVRVLRRRARDGKGFYSVIRVEDVREIRDGLHMTRGRAGQRVAIIDPIDDCNINAANALLKTLEEPPADTTFLLVSHRPGSLLPTIRSRCQTLAMRAPGDRIVHEVLGTQLPGADAHGIDTAVARSGGRPRRGFEALALGTAGPLDALEAWLADPGGATTNTHLAIGDALGTGGWGSGVAFARDLISDWITEEARTAAIGRARMRLASANELWEKADAQFAEAEALNLDLRQTFIGLFDAIRAHVQTTHPQSAETQ